MKRLLCLIGLITTTSGGGEIGRFLADYAQWRRWEQAAVFTTVRESISEATSATKSLNDGGVFTSLLSMEDVQLTASLIVPRHRLGVVLFLNQSGATDLLELVSQKLLFNCYLSWLLVIDDVTYDGEQLRNLNIGLDSDVTLAITGEQVACKQAECVKPNITLHQVYKVRATSNTSLVVERLGAWNVVTKMTSMGTPSDVERRGDLKGYPLIVGVRQVVDADQLTEAVDEDRDNDMNLLEVLDYISGSLNTRFVQNGVNEARFNSGLELLT